MKNCIIAIRSKCVSRRCDPLRILRLLDDRFHVDGRVPGSCFKPCSGNQVCPRHYRQHTARATVFYISFSACIVAMRLFQPRVRLLWPRVRLFQSHVRLFRPHRTSQRRFDFDLHGTTASTSTELRHRSFRLEKHHVCVASEYVSVGQTSHIALHV
jgi:hypothetical protein